MNKPPSGTVTFLFTDIEGSTKRWEQYPEQMRHALHSHDEIVRSAIEAEGGYVFKTMGDAFCAAFPTAPQAVKTVIAAQKALAAEHDESTHSSALKVRMALHTGAAQSRDGDYFGQPVNRVARLLSAGHGGQTLLSLAAQELARDSLPVGANLLDLGEHRLKDLQRPERVFQLDIQDLPVDFPPLRTLDTHPNNLPVQPSPFIGREKEAGEVAAMLLRDDVRLLTLTGPGGTGKTRLSMQVAANLLEEFPDGVFFVNLAPISDPDLVVSTVAQTLNVKEASGQRLLDTLKAYLQEKRMLLLLDNVEQVTKAAPSIGDLLANCANLKVLATSRVPLRLRTEREYAVPPLGLPPDPKHLPSVERLSQYEAVRLFIDRAQAVKANFEVTNENAPAVAEICARLDGLPLAIELAATRIRLLPPQAMLSRLQNRLRLLIGGAQDLPARQQTLRAAIEWSYDLLSPDEQKFFRRLAVFVGGRTLEAIEAVCNAEGDLGIDILDGVESLVSKSLLRQEEGTGGEPRFVMLETIHEYAREKLEESGEAEEIQRQHAEYFLVLVEEAEPQLTGPKQVEWFEKLESEHDNIRAVLTWELERNEIELAQRVASAIWLFWVVRGHMTEGDIVLARVLSNSNMSTRPTGMLSLAKTLYGTGFIAWKRGEYVRARSLLEQSLTISRPLGEIKLMVDTLNLLGRILLQYSGDHASATVLLEEALATARQLGDSSGISFSLVGLGHLATAQRNFALAESLHEQSLVLRREIGDKYNITVSLGNLANAAGAQGKHALARSLYKEKADLGMELGDKASLTGSLIGLGELERYAGAHKTARPYFEEALRLAREVEEKRDASDALHSLGFIAYHDGDHVTAINFFIESLKGWPEPKEVIGVAACLVGFAALATQEERGGERAAQLLGAVETMLERVNSPLWEPDQLEYEANLTAIRSLLEEGELEQAVQRGRAMSMEQAIAYALENTPDD